MLGKETQYTERENGYIFVCSLLCNFLTKNYVSYIHRKSVISAPLKNLGLKISTLV